MIDLVWVGGGAIVGALVALTWKLAGVAARVERLERHTAELWDRLP